MSDQAKGFPTREGPARLRATPSERGEGGNAVHFFLILDGWVGESVRALKFVKTMTFGLFSNDPKSNPMASFSKADQTKTD